MNKRLYIFLIRTFMLLYTCAYCQWTPLMAYAITTGNDYEYELIPEEAMEEDISNPDHIIGTGTPESCTADAFIEAVAMGGVIVFNGGDEPFTITLDEPAKVFNNQNQDIVIDGGGLVTLSGGDKTRILYMNTCDPDQVWTTGHCQNQESPRLTVQNLTFAKGNATNETEYTGGGAIWVRGGRFKVINCRFINNRCQETGPDVGGGAIRVFSQYEGKPVYIVNSTFGGAKGLGNIGSNGGAISSIGVSWTIINSVFSYNEAVGDGGNPAKSGTVGGGSGGAIYNDGNEMNLEIIGSRIEYNKVNAYGSGIFFVSNNHTGEIKLHDTTVENNIGGSWYPVISDISMHSDTKITITESEVSTDIEEELEVLATPTVSPVIVDGQVIAFEAYNINGNNYFKLRDIAAILDGTSSQFEIVWVDETKQIMLLENESYTVVGGELEVIENQLAQQCKKTYPNISMNGEAVELSTYLIHDNNFFKLRDLSGLIGFGVEWDEENRLVLIDSE